MSGGENLGGDDPYRGDCHCDQQSDYHDGSSGVAGFGLGSDLLQPASELSDQLPDDGEFNEHGTSSPYQLVLAGIGSRIHALAALVGNAWGSAGAKIL